MPYLHLPHRPVTAGTRMADYLEFDPAIVDKRQVYRLLTGAVVPRPIGWASTVSKNGVTNLAPFSFFTVVCVIPPMISLTIARNPDGSEKHTLEERARDRRVLLQRGDASRCGRRWSIRPTPFRRTIPNSPKPG